jgi:hypothetical protein|tara:strand:+ start:104 stop:367 length:264 start_codon:yes stop_codon:yes gene_type:complete
MDFIEEIDEFNIAMDNAYDLITGKVSLDTLETDLKINGIETFILPFDPLHETGTDPDTLDFIIEHFENLEEYEKCQVLLRIKNKTHG